MSNTAKKTALRYMVLPEFLPRFGTLFSSGFGYLAFLIARIYESVRLLPKNHTYLKTENIGRFGIRNVMAEAANNLVFSRENADQIIIYFTILAGLIILAMQFVLFVVALVAHQPVFAYSVQELFHVDSSLAQRATHYQDLAFIIMDRVFGISGIFDSCVADTTVQCFNFEGRLIASPGTYPTAFHEGLHFLLRFYSFGIFVIAVLLILYFIAAVIGETAASGTPFGQRTNRTWAPIRLIVFFALLVPLNIGNTNAGLNAAQIITFWVAKTGSNFATNAWGVFNSNITDTFLGDRNDLVATSKPPSLGPLLQYMFIAKTCRTAHELLAEYDTPIGSGNTDGLPPGINAYLVRSELPENFRDMGDPGATPPIPPNPIDNGENWLPLATTDFGTAMRFSRNGTINIAIGTRQPNDSTYDYKKYKGQIFPYCGQITLPIKDLDRNNGVFTGSMLTHTIYYNILAQMWDDTVINQYTECIINRTITTNTKDEVDCNLDPGNDFVIDRQVLYETQLKIDLDTMVNRQINTKDWSVPIALRNKGWAGAAIWYNRIAEINGEMSTAVQNTPIANRYPYVMEVLAAYNAQNQENLSLSEAFDPTLASDEKSPLTPEQAKIAPALYEAFKAWEEDELYSDHTNSKTGNPVLDMLNVIFGTSGIFEMRDNTNIHPLAQLSTLGRSMMEASIRNVTGGMAVKTMNSNPKSTTSILAGVATAFGMATITISFILYYILPFLPFIYFLFAVSGWVKSIFEAIVAMPLWALAHIRIDGEGLPGRDAANGYYLLFEIFLRPILILFGLISSIIIFSSLVTMLNDIFDLVVSNVSGFDLESELSGGANLIDYMRGPLDEFFLTAIYVIICYMMALSCFKLIDLIPNNILRWGGSAVQTFQENAGDPAQQIVSQTYAGLALTTGQIRGGALATIL